MMYDVRCMCAATWEWSRPLVAGLVPRPRYGHICSAVGSQLVLFGGFAQGPQGGVWLNSLYILDTGVCVCVMCVCVCDVYVYLLFV